MNKSTGIWVTAMLLGSCLGACDQAGLQGNAPDAAQGASPTALTEVAKPGKLDPVPRAKLEAGLAAVTPLILARHDAYMPIKPGPDARLFMHPDANKDAAVEIDVSGVSQLTLSPYVSDLSQDKDCANAKDGGVVSVSWALDAQAPAAISVDQAYDELVMIDTSGAEKLTISVNSGNGTNTCDWAGVGFVDVVAR